MCNWIKGEVGAVLPPTGEKVLIVNLDGTIEYRPLKKRVDEFGDGRCEQFAYYARVIPPNDLERVIDHAG